MFLSYSKILAEFDQKSTTMGTHFYFIHSGTTLGRSSVSHMGRGRGIGSHVARTFALLLIKQRLLSLEQRPTSMGPTPLTTNSIPNSRALYIEPPSKNGLNHRTGS